MHSWDVHKKRFIILRPVYFRGETDLLLTPFLCILQYLRLKKMYTICASIIMELNPTRVVGTH